MKQYRSKRKLLTALVILLGITSALCLAVSAINAHMIAETSEDILTSSAVREEYDCIFVLGAGLREDGSPSHMLEDRLLTALALYENGAAEKIVLSGDRSGDYNEPGAMYGYLTERGVPEDALVCHYTGYSTSASVKWAAEEYADGDIIIVTQRYHLYRALYMADELDLDAVGVGSDPRTYAGQTLRDIREFAARVKDFILIKLTK